MKPHSLITADAVVLLHPYTPVKLQGIPGRTQRKTTTSFTQRQKRKNRRRAHAAGHRKAFAA